MFGQPRDGDIRMLRDCEGQVPLGRVPCHRIILPFDLGFAMASLIAVPD